MRNVLLVCLVAFCVPASTVFGNTWLVGTGTDQDWYNTANWSTGIVPVAGEVVGLNDAMDPGHGVVIDGLGGSRPAAACGYFGLAPWSKVTSSVLITNGATLDTNSVFYVSCNTSDAAHGPTFINLTVNGGSVVNINGEQQLGRYQGYAGGNILDQITINIDGAGTVWHSLAGRVMYIGWATSAASTPLTMNVTDGALVKVDAVAGLQLNYSGNKDAVINLAGGTIQLAGDRSGAVAGYITKKWLIGYNDAGTVQYDYNVTTPGYTTVWAIPEPATVALFGLGAMTLLRKSRK